MAKASEILSPGKPKEKKSKKKHSSIADTGFNENFDGSLNDISVTLRKKKKKKKSSHHETEISAGVIGENLTEDVSEGKLKEKKSKKRRSSVVDPSLNESFEDNLVTPGKKKKKKKHSLIDSDINENVGGSHMGKKKKLLSASATELQESCEDEYKGSSPKKKKRKSTGDENDLLDSSFKDSLDLIPKHKKQKKRESIEENHLKSPVNVNESTKKKRLSLKGNKSMEKDEITYTGNGYAKNHSACWSLQEELSLIDSVLSHLNPEDTKGYMITLRKIDWKNVAIKDRTPKECNDMLNKLISKISKFKTLAMVLTEAKEEASDSASRLKKLLPAKTRFILDYCRKHKSEMSFNELRAKASVVWSELSSKEKKPYKIQYEGEKEKLKETMDLPPDDPRLPFTFYYLSEIEKGGTKGKELRAKCSDLFKNMKIKDKSPYILKSCKEWAKYITEYKSYKELHPDFDKPMPKFNCTQLVQQYLEYLGMPKKVSSVTGIFMEDMIKKGKFPKDAKNPLSVASSMYRELPENEKEKYKMKRRNELPAYEQAYKLWMENVDDDIALVFNTFVKKSNLKVGEKKSKENFEFTNTVEVSMAKPKFNEPEKPASTPLKLFQQYFRKKRKDKYNDTKEMDKACFSAWKSLPEDLKARYDERCEENRTTYKENLLQYVRSLGDVTKVYLGFKRKEHYSYFKEDIFKEEYPPEEYPVYVLTKKDYTGSPIKGGPKEELQQAVSKVQNSSSDNESSDGDEDSSDDGTKQNPPIDHQQITTTKDSSDNENSSEEDENDIGHAWETPQKSLQKADDSEDDDDDEEEEEEDEDDDSDSE